MINKTYIIPSEYKIILRDLYISKGYTNVYSFYIKYNLKPHQIAECLTLLINNKIISKEKDKISITEYGRNWIFANRTFLFLSKQYEYWKTPYTLKQKGLEVESDRAKGYLLNVRKIDKSLFITKKKDGQET